MSVEVEKIKQREKEYHERFREARELPIVEVEERCAEVVCRPALRPAPTGIPTIRWLFISSSLNGTHGTGNIFWTTAVEMAFGRYISR